MYFYKTNVGSPILAYFTGYKAEKKRLCFILLMKT